VDAWIEAMALGDCVTFVVHDWGSALGFLGPWRHPRRAQHRLDGGDR